MAKTDKTRFIVALRPFSLIVAIVTCGLGVSLALLDGVVDTVLAGLVVFNGVLLQMAVNLINDQRDLHHLQLPSAKKQAVQRNTTIGYGFMLVAILIGLYMVTLRGWPLLLLGMIGIFGAWGYTGGQINYKARGLGILLVFFFMGMLLIGGAYYVMTGQYHLRVFWLSLPFSLLSSLLLLSNELRDYEEDMAQGIKTLCVRFGYGLGVKLYYSLLSLLYFMTVMLYQTAMLDHLVLLLIAAFALWQPVKLLHVKHSHRHRLTPMTGRFYAIYSAAFMLTLWTSMQ